MPDNLPIIEVDREASRRLESGHPWVHDSAVKRVSGDPGPGALVQVLSGGRRLGEGMFSPASRIRVRLVSGPAQKPLEGEDSLMAELEVRTRAAVALREKLGLIGSRSSEPGARPGAQGGGAARIAFGESDGLPGLVADLYSDTLVVQFLSAGMDLRREAVVEMLRRVISPEAVVERSDTGNREREGLKPVRGLLYGALPEDGRVPFEAAGLLLQADPLGGQKTGFYLDQRDNWIALRPLAGGRRVLDVCCYTGAFGLSLLKGESASLKAGESSPLWGGADSLVGIDSSARAIGLAEESARRNGLADKARFVEGDAGAVMTRMSTNGEKFGFVMLDPPALAKTRAHRVLAARAVRALNDAALAVVEPGGLLFTCSCTPWITGDDLAETVAHAAARSGRRVSVLEVRGQSRDHPAHPLMPETRYLAGLLFHVV